MTTRRWSPGPFTNGSDEGEFFNGIALATSDPTSLHMLTRDDRTNRWHTLAWSDGDAPSRTPLETFSVQDVKTAALRGDAEGTLRTMVMNNIDGERVWQVEDFRKAFPNSRDVAMPFAFVPDARLKQRPIPITLEPIPEGFADGLPHPWTDQAPHSGDLTGQANTLAHAMFVGGGIPDQPLGIALTIITQRLQQQQVRSSIGSDSSNGYYDGGVTALHVTRADDGSITTRVLGVVTWTDDGYTRPPLCTEANAYALHATAWTESLEKYGVGALCIPGRGALQIRAFHNTIEQVGTGNTTYYAGLMSQKGLLVPEDLNDRDAPPEWRFDGLSPSVDPSGPLITVTQDGRFEDQNGWIPDMQLIEQHMREIIHDAIPLPLAVPQPDVPQQPDVPRQPDVPQQPDVQRPRLRTSDVTQCAVPPCAVPHWIVQHCPMIDRDLLQNIWEQEMQECNNDMRAAAAMTTQLLPTIIDRCVAPNEVTKMTDTFQQMMRRMAQRCNIVAVGEDATTVAVSAFGIGHKTNFVHTNGPLSFISSKPTNIIPGSNTHGSNQACALAYAAALTVAMEGPSTQFTHDASTSFKVAVAKEDDAPLSQWHDSTPIAIMDGGFNSHARSVVHLHNAQVDDACYSPALLQRGVIVQVSRMTTLSNRVQEGLDKWAHGNTTGVVPSTIMSELPLNAMAMAGPGVVLIATIVDDRTHTITTHDTAAVTTMSIFAGGTYPEVDDDFGHDARPYLNVLFSDEPHAARAKCGELDHCNHRMTGLTHRIGYVETSNGDREVSTCTSIAEGRARLLEDIASGCLSDEISNDQFQQIRRTVRPLLETISIHGDSTVFSNVLVKGQMQTQTTVASNGATDDASVALLQAQLQELRAVVAANRCITSEQKHKWKTISAQLPHSIRRRRAANCKRSGGNINKLTCLLFSGRDNGTRITAGQMTMGGAKREENIATMNVHALDLTSDANALFDYMEEHPTLCSNFLVLHVKDLALLTQLVADAASGRVPSPSKLFGPTSAAAGSTTHADTTAPSTTALDMDGRCNFVDLYTGDALVQGRRGPHPMLVDSHTSDTMAFIGGDVQQPMVLWPLPNMDQQLREGTPASVAVDYQPFGILLGVLKNTLFGKSSPLARDHSIGNLHDARSDHCMLYMVLLIGDRLLRMYPSTSCGPIDPHDTLPACFRSLVQTALVTSGRGGITPINRVIATLFHGRPSENNPSAFNVAACKLLGKMAMRGGLDARAARGRLWWALCVRPINARFIQPLVQQQLLSNEEHRRIRQFEEHTTFVGLNGHSHLERVFDAMVTIKMEETPAGVSRDALDEHIATDHAGGNRNPSAHGGRRLLWALAEGFSVAQLHLFCGGNQKKPVASRARGLYTHRDDYYDEALLRFFVHGMQQLFNMSDNVQFVLGELSRAESVANESRPWLTGQSTPPVAPPLLTHLCVLMGTKNVCTLSKIARVDAQAVAEMKACFEKMAAGCNRTAAELRVRIDAFRHARTERIAEIVARSNCIASKTTLQTMVDAHAKCRFTPQKIQRARRLRSLPIQGYRQTLHVTTTTTTTTTTTGVMTTATSTHERLQTTLDQLRGSTANGPAVERARALIRLVATTDAHPTLNLQALRQTAPELFNGIPMAGLMDTVPPGDRSHALHMLRALFEATIEAMAHPGHTVHNRPIAEVTMLQRLGYPLVSDSASAGANAIADDVEEHDDDVEEHDDVAAAVKDITDE